MDITNTILSNIIWALLGYLVGSINFSILLTLNNKKRESIVSVGSGNPGATNALRNYGLKFGLLIFLLDVSKSFWFTFIGVILLKHTYFFENLFVQAISISVIIGHIFPIFFKFKGGKGAATNLGIVCSISLLLTLVGLVLFLIIFLTTKYVSLASMTTPFLIAPFTFIPQFNGWYDSFLYGTWVNGSSDLYWLSFLTLLIAGIITLLSHIPNIKKLIKGTETKTILKNISKK